MSALWLPNSELYADDPDWEDPELGISVVASPMRIARRRLKLLSVYDGDSGFFNPKFWLTLRMGFRLRGIQCAEIKDKRPEARKLALEARSFFIEIVDLYAREFQAHNIIFPDAHGRIVCDVESLKGAFRGKQALELLLARGLGTPYDGRGKAPIFPPL